MISKITIGEDVKGKYIDHMIHTDNSPLIAKVSRIHYNYIDKVLIENMPQDILDSVMHSIEEEQKRRLDERARLPEKDCKPPRG